MKVYLGPYVDWWSSRVFRDYMDKKYNYDWDEATTPFEKFLDKLEDALNTVYYYTVNQIFKRMKRKIKVKIHDYDVWGLDNTLAHIIHPALVLLKEQKHGAPHVDDEDVPEELRSTSAPPLTQEEKDCGHTDDLWFKRWDWVMDEMIYAFACELDEDWEDQFTSGTMDMRWKKCEDNPKFSTMYYGPNHTYEVDDESRKKAWDRRKNGLRLFAKYYHSLWD